MKKVKQILVIVWLGGIAFIAQASSVGCSGSCPLGQHCSIDGNGGAGGCVPNIGATRKKSTTSKEAIVSDAQTHKHNKKGLKDVKRS